MPNAPVPEQTPLSPPQRLRIARETVSAYVVARRLARNHPLPETLQRIRTNLEAAPPRSAVTANPYRLSMIVQRVLRLLPTDTRCLMQTLTLLIMLTKRGVDGTVVISTDPGVKFGAHAWLEVDGRPLLPPERSDLRLVEL